MKDHKVLEVLNVNDSLIFVWGTDEHPIEIDYSSFDEKTKEAWDIISTLLVNL